MKSVSPTESSNANGNMTWVRRVPDISPGLAEYGQTRVKGVSLSVSYKSHKGMAHDMLVNFASVPNTVSQAIQTIVKFTR